jgi:integrase
VIKTYCLSFSIDQAKTGSERLNVTAAARSRNAARKPATSAGFLDAITEQRLKRLNTILGDMSERPGAVNGLLKALRVLLRHAVDMGSIHDNPARNVRKLPVLTEGFHSWTENDVEMLEVAHRPGTRAHLALALLLYTGQRRSDVVRMGW